MELFNKILRTAVEGGASDIHIKPDSPVVYASTSQLVETEMTQSPTQEWLEKIIKGNCAGTLSAPAQGRPRDRLLLFSGGCRPLSYKLFSATPWKWCLAMRYVVAEVPKIDGLNLPEVIKSIAEEHRGIVLVAGTTGSNESTTLAGMIDHINTNLAVYPHHDGRPGRVRLRGQPVHHRATGGRTRHPPTSTDSST